MAVPARAVVSPPGPGGAGDYATNIALQLARPAGQPALRVAEVLRTHLARSEGVTCVEITGPGFLNISLDRHAAGTALVRRILAEGMRYGHGDSLAGQVYEVRVPFEVRAEVLADALARIVASQGGRVAVHHLAGAQHFDARPLDHLDAQPLDAQPLDAQHLAVQPSPGASEPPFDDSEPRPGVSEPAFAVSEPAFAVSEPAFAVSEPLPGAPGPLPGSSQPLPGSSHPSQSPRAASQATRTAASPATRIAVQRPHLNSRSAPTELTTPLEAAQPAGDPRPTAPPTATPTPLDLRPHPAPEDPTPLGLDAACWALLHPAPHDRPRVTADHLVQRESNPLFRVRYAHARTRALGRNAGDLGFTAEAGGMGEEGEEGGHAASLSLLPLLADYPRVLATVAALPRAEGVAAPSRLARYLVVLADATLALLPVVLPLGEEKPSAAHRARLALAEAAGTVLAGGLSLLGIDAPDHL
ncbi:hypothetical protein AQJ58_10390 [Streptomyces sp. DSM 15324]|nr:hypothetical protein AQJ58_10390 [Streptomyces sp. DSM 15324]